MPEAPPRGLIAGFDAGQTHTSCRLADATDGRVLAEGQGPGVSHLAAADGPERFQEALRSSLEVALRALATGGQSTAEPALLAAAVGASGIETGSTVEEQGRQLAAAALALPPQRLWLGGDERTALRGAFPDGPGIVVISGTGTIAVGRDGRPAQEGGREHRCAGWGWLLDGAGSAFDIGRDGLALSLEMADGRVADGPLRRQLWQALELDPDDPAAPQAIKALVVGPGFMPAGLAALAPLLEHLAAAGDAGAGAILSRNAAALAASVAGVARALALTAPPVAALGGAITHLPGFRQRFREALNQALPAAALVTPAGDALSGALALAAERLAALRGVG